MCGLRLLLALGFLCLFGCSQSPSTSKPGSERVDSDAGPLNVSGPYTHANLSVFLLRSDTQDKREFLTLDQGLKDGTVKITELDSESVQQLKISNDSGQPLYLQEGERLIGGKQDRTIAASLVLPPKSGPTTIPTFCIEQSRWTEGSTGRKFGFSLNPALAPKGVRGSAKFNSSQDEVWNTVRVQKDAAQKQMLSKNTTSSANELFDAPEVRKISEDYAGALASALKEHPDAVGVAIVVNGLIEEVNLYPNHALLAKLYPRLVQSYAVQATMLKDKDGAGKTLTAAEVAAFLKKGKEQSSQTRTLNDSTKAVSRQFDDNKFECETTYNGKVIHRQMMKKNGSLRGRGVANDVLGSDW